MRKKIIISLGIIAMAAGVLAALALFLPKNPVEKEEITSHQIDEKQLKPEEINIKLKSDLAKIDLKSLKNINPDIVA
ncbi:MAG: hypothetical protein K6F00_10305, partial [Lachnospiraceae bacterium]|nr:hypothetical protein [Lachnospiraceae bacterium]